MTISQVPKRGLETYASTSPERAEKTAFETFQQLDLGPGGYAVAPAGDAKAVIARAIGAKRGTRP